MKLSLVVLTPGKSEGKAIPITLAQFLIGRDPQCQLRPASASISKRHCAILVKGEKVFLRDLDSTNGSSVNGQPVKGEVELHHDDKLKIGPLDFSVRLEAAAPASKPTPPPPSKGAPAKGPARPTTPLPKKQAEALDDDDVASMLLSLQDDGDSAAPSEDEIPSGSTVIIVPPGLAPAEEGAPAARTQPGEPPKDKLAAVKQEMEDTSKVAKAILQKYMRRPRSG